MIHFDKYLIIRIFPYGDVEFWSVDNFPRSRFPTGLASYPEYLHSAEGFCHLTFDCQRRVYSSCNIKCNVSRDHITQVVDSRLDQR